MNTDTTKPTTTTTTNYPPPVETRDEAISRIRSGLKRRTGMTWSVGRGTAWGYRLALAKILGLDKVHHQGVSVPASNDYYNEFVDRAEGRAPRVGGKPYWD